MIIKGFNPTNPHNGDAIIATFFWLGSTNIIDSVTDVLTTGGAYTPVGNTYTLVEYVTAGGMSMATYVATDVHSFPDGFTGLAQDSILAVAAHLSQPVTHGASCSVPGAGEHVASSGRALLRLGLRQRSNDRRSRRDYGRDGRTRVRSDPVRTV